jgi:Ala-tRNA(Pro) deacylase
MIENDIKIDSMNVEKRVLDFLSSLGIGNEILHHEAMESMGQYQDIEKEHHIVIPKNLFLTNRQQTKFYLLLMPGDKPFKTKELSSQINSARLSFGSLEKLSELLHCYHGSTSVFGLMFDVNNEIQLLIDEDLLDSEKLGFHPCVNTATVMVKKEDVLNCFLPAVHHEYIRVKLTGEE